MFVGNDGIRVYNLLVDYENVLILLFLLWREYKVNLKCLWVL